MEESRYDHGMQTARGNIDFEAFTDKMKELLSIAWGEGEITFEHDEPQGNDPEGIVLPIITYDTFERVRSKTHPSLEPIKFSTVQDPDRPDRQIELYRMWFDVETEFKIYHKTNKDARIVLSEFEDFLWRYKSYFKEIGISDIVFLAETKPTVVERYGQRLPERTLRYLIRTERITTKPVQSAKTIRGTIQEPTGGMDLGLGGSTPIIDNYHDQFRE